MAVQKIPYDGPRVEGPAVQFGEDWPGLFLRGDHCIAVAGAIERVQQLLAGNKDAILPLALLEGVKRDIMDQVLR